METNALSNSLTGIALIHMQFLSGSISVFAFILDMCKFLKKKINVIILKTAARRNSSALSLSFENTLLAVPSEPDKWILLSPFKSF